MADSNSQEARNRTIFTTPTITTTYWFSDLLPERGGKTLFTFAAQQSLINFYTRWVSLMLTGTP
jgi:hypothetical protein